MLGKKSVEQINAKISSIIGADMVVDGNIRAKEAVRVEGSVTGDVETEGALIISSSGKVKGNVKGSSIIIGGSLEGDLTSGGRTEVASTVHHGTLQYHYDAELLRTRNIRFRKG